MATEGEQARLERVRELEAMVHKLTVENEKLLTRVQTPPPSRVEEKSSPGQPSSPGEKLLDEDEEGGVLALSDVEEAEEDEWLYVSPARPPTPKQKAFTPTEWLSGERGGRGVEKEVPSLDEVRKALASTMDEAEQLISSPSSRTNRRMQPSNKTAQKYLDRVRQRRRSPMSESEESSPGSLSPADPRSHSPLLVKKQRNIPARPLIPRGLGKKQAESTPQSNPPSLKVNWTPQSGLQSDEAREVAQDSLKIHWDPSKAVASDEDEESQQHKSLKVSWTVRVPVEEEEEEEEEAEVVPIVKWNPKQVRTEEREEAVPVVKWNPKQIPEDGKALSHHTQVEERENKVEEEVPRVLWKVRNVSEPQSRSQVGQPQARAVVSPENVSGSSLKVNWTPPSQRAPADNPLKIRWNPNMASPSSSSEEDISTQRPLEQAAGSQEEKETHQRLSRYAAHVSQLSSQPTASSPPATIGSGLPGRRTSPASYASRPVASVSPLQKGAGTGLRQPSPGRSSIPAPSPPALKPASGQTIPAAAARSRSLSPSQRGQGSPKGGYSQLRQPSSPSQNSNSNGESTPTQSRLRSPGLRGGSLGRKAGMRIYQPLNSPSPTGRGSTQHSDRPSIIPPQSSPNLKYPSPALQQHKLTPVGVARPNGQQHSPSSIRQPASHSRRPATRGSLLQSPSPGKSTTREEWLEGCF